MAGKVVIKTIFQKRVGINVDVLGLLANKIVKDLMPALIKKEEILISLVVTSNKEIKSLNKKYRGINNPTDVLSFSYLEKGVFKESQQQEDRILGEIIISADILKKQAIAYKHPQKKELEVLFVHGLLHILGFDHEKKTHKKEMLKFEQKHLGDKSGLIGR